MDMDDFATRMENAMNANAERIQNDIHYEMSKQKYGTDSTGGPSLIPIVVVVAILGVLYLTFIAVPSIIIFIVFGIGHEMVTNQLSFFDVIKELVPPQFVELFQSIPKEVWIILLIGFCILSLAFLAGLIALIVVIRRKKKKKQQQYYTYNQNYQNYR